MLCSAVLCCAAPCCSVLCCGALCSVVPYRAVSCRGVSCRGVAGCAVLCRAALCCAVLCRVVGCLVAACCTAVHCAAVCRVASCCAVFRCAVVCGGSVVPLFRSGVASALVRLVRFAVWDAGQGYVVDWWPGARLGVARLVGSVLRGSACAVRLVVSGGCPWGCPPWGPVPWSRVLWGSLLLGLCGALCVGNLWSSGCVGSPTVLSLCLLVVLRPGCRSRIPFSLRCPGRCVCVVALAVAGVVPWRRGCGARLCAVLGDYLCGCSPFSPCWCTLLPLCGARWPVGAT